MCGEGTRLDGGVCNKRFGQFFLIWRTKFKTNYNLMLYVCVCNSGFYWNNVIYDRCNRMDGLEHSIVFKLNELHHKSLLYLHSIVEYFFDILFYIIIVQCEHHFNKPS